LQITDNLGCTYSQCTNLVPNNNLNLPFSFNVDNSSCPGVNDGSITATVPGAQSFSWSGPNGLTSQSPAISNLQPGQYCLTVTDVNNCSDDSCVFVVANPFNPSISINSTPTSCALSSDGSASVIAGNFSGNNLTYVWTTGPTFVGTSNEISSLSAGNYCVEITDENNCIAEQCVNVAAGVGANADFEFSTVAPSCPGSASGSISVTVTGATGNLSYSWTGGNLTTPASGSTINGLTGGNYTVVVTDALGCEYSASQALIPNAELNATFNIDVTNLSCPGANNGALALVSVTGAGAITSIEWTFGNTPISNDSTITGLVSGLYTISITDINGCETEASRFVGVNT
ncbi:MAG: SprB repeat-containing protein, partial [Flavobacteriales bacterium]